jgi:hypothetical protein
VLTSASSDQRAFDVLAASLPRAWWTARGSGTR